MHYFYEYADDFIFDSYKQFSLDLSAEERCGSGAYEYFLDQLTDKKHQAIINNIERFIDSGKKFYFSKGPC